MSAAQFISDWYPVATPFIALIVIIIAIAVFDKDPIP